MNISDLAVRTVLSLGGNQGNVIENFRMTRSSLEKAGMTSVKTSSVYRTKPIDCASGTPDFINAAISGIWHGSVESLFQLTKRLEILSGRPEIHSRNSDRPLDIDIILFGNIRINTESLTIPHKEAVKRLFVLIPVSEAAPEMLFPSEKMTAAEILRSMTDHGEIKTFRKSKISELF